MLELCDHHVVSFACYAIRFLLKDGQLWLCEPQARQIWECLAVNAIHPCDRENCFKWFTKVSGRSKCHNLAFRIHLKVLYFICASVFVAKIFIVAQFVFVL